ncbi:hypothetical protein BC831DRAFT_471310, partial [Entophlyctis helioformis]
MDACPVHTPVSRRSTHTTHTTHTTHHAHHAHHAPHHPASRSHSTPFSSSQSLLSGCCWSRHTRLCRVTPWLSQTASSTTRLRPCEHRCSHDQDHWGHCDPHHDLDTPVQPFTLGHIRYTHTHVARSSRSSRSSRSARFLARSGSRCFCLDRFGDTRHAAAVTPARVPLTAVALSVWVVFSLLSFVRSFVRSCLCSG